MVDCIVEVSMFGCLNVWKLKMKLLKKELLEKEEARRGEVVPGE